jgi:hypothetical protein
VTERYQRSALVMALVGTFDAMDSNCFQGLRRDSGWHWRMALRMALKNNVDDAST